MRHKQQRPLSYQIIKGFGHNKPPSLQKKADTNPPRLISAHVHNHERSISEGSPRSSNHDLGTTVLAIYLAQYKLLVTINFLVNDFALIRNFTTPFHMYLHRRYQSDLKSSTTIPGKRAAEPIHHKLGNSHFSHNTR